MICPTCGGELVLREVVHEYWVQYGDDEGQLELAPEIQPFCIHCRPEADALSPGDEKCALSGFRTTNTSHPFPSHENVVITG